VPTPDAGIAPAPVPPGAPACADGAEVSIARSTSSRAVRATVQCDRQRVVVDLPAEGAT
jgi:hypothetical protein